MSFRTLRGAAALVGVVTMAAIVACSSEEEEKREAARAAEEAAKSAFLDDYCAIVEGCCGRAFNRARDIPGCKARATALDPKMLADAAARADCLTQLRAAAPAADFCSDFGNIDQPACPGTSRKALTGSKKVGDACAETAECAPSFEGIVACEGVCQLTRRGKEGDGPCVATIEATLETRLEGDAPGPEVFECFVRDGLVCDPGSTKCMRPIALGGACASSASCERVAYCDAGTKKCATRKANGSSCQEGQCQGRCVEGFCAPASPEGGDCADRTMCEGSLACVDGTCTKAPEDAHREAVCIDQG